VTVDRVHGASVTLGAGMFARIRAGEPPVIVPAAEAAAFPRFDPATVNETRP
jgi:hypothetical protein